MNFSPPNTTPEKIQTRNPARKMPFFQTPMIVLLNIIDINSIIKK
jgi:hypothetical protein